MKGVRDCVNGRVMIVIVIMVMVVVMMMRHVLFS
jgi:hypothetical protein